MTKGYKQKTISNLFIILTLCPLLFACQAVVLLINCFIVAFRLDKSDDFTT